MFKNNLFFINNLVVAYLNWRVGYCPLILFFKKMKINVIVAVISTGRKPYPTALRLEMVMWWPDLVTPS